MTGILTRDCQKYVQAKGCLHPTVISLNPKTLLVVLHCFEHLSAVESVKYKAFGTPQTLHLCRIMLAKHWGDSCLCIVRKEPCPHEGEAGEGCDR